MTTTLGGIQGPDCSSGGTEVIIAIILSVKLGFISFLHAHHVVICKSFQGPGGKSNPHLML